MTELPTATWSLHLLSMSIIGMTLLAAGTAQSQQAEATDRPPVDTAAYSAHDTTRVYREVTPAEVARRLIGPGAVFRAVALSGIDQAMDNPVEWSHDTRGYGNRLGARAAGGAITQVMELGVAATLHVRRARPSRCECSGFGPRLAHGLLTPLRVETRTGTRLSAVMPIGHVGGAMLSTPLLPGGFSAKRGLQRGVTAGLVSSAVGTVVEFWPQHWLPRHFQRSRRSR